MKIERQLKHIGAAWGLSNSNPNYSSRWPRKEEKNGADVKKEKHSNVKCFRRLGSQCPNKKIMLIRDDGEIDSGA